VLEVALAPEELDIGAVEEARADGLIGEAVHMLDQVQPDHEAGEQPGAADALAVERAEGRGEALPVDQAGEPHQGMAANPLMPMRPAAIGPSARSETGAAAMVPHPRSEFTARAAS
jgi:hypothetical protein